MESLVSKLVNVEVASMSLRACAVLACVPKVFAFWSGNSQP